MDHYCDGINNHLDWPNSQQFYGQQDQQQAPQYLTIGNEQQQLNCPEENVSVPEMTAKKGKIKKKKKKQKKLHKTEIKEETEERHPEKFDEILPAVESANGEMRRIAGGINGAFAALRTRIPTFPFEKRLSKIDTLNLACAYINLLEELIDSEEPPSEYLARTIQQAKDGQQPNFSVWGTSDLLARLNWINWPAMGMPTPPLIRME